ncbi:Uncharacterized protein M6B38_223895 [Iris pallida]|uniref:Uncharacterized protein n=1 Tax=Iris pallida TaxID=29817 RepID=A0AAX6DW01_IRIPA|nr:Uncharacterized protein M6B38_223895 [Iris pallida]
MPSLFLLSSSVLLPKTLTLTLRPFPLSGRRRHCGSITSVHASDPDLLPRLTAGDSTTSHHLPAVRSYENDLARLTLVGSVAFEQALTAAAADGGEAAEEHLSAGTQTMVVETVFPGSADDHSTVSTRLFLPAKKVKEKAKKLRSSLTADILSSNSIVSNNILAMTFRQVVLQGLGSFKLSIFCPGTERDMKNLANPKEVSEQLTASSSDERFISTLAEVVCSCLLKSTDRFYQKHVGGSPSKSIFDWYQGPQRILALDTSICLYRISRDEIMKKASKQLERFNLAKEKSVNWRQRKLKHRWWEPPDYSMLDKIGGPGFGVWVNEFIPTYKLQIDANSFKDVKLEGWQEMGHNRWEVLLTHFQMVELASIFDMFYEDQYTLPDKELSCGLMTESPVISRNKNSTGKWLFVSLLGGFIIVSVSVLAQLCRPNPLRARNVPDQKVTLPSSEICAFNIKSLEAPELEDLCISLVKKIRDDLGWTEDIMTEREIGTWTGSLPGCLRGPDVVRNAIPCKEESTTSCSSGNLQIHEEPKISEISPAGIDDLAKQMAQDIASYQVVLSGDGRLVGFQPTSRVAVNHWASNPLAKVLYQGRRLSPGILEPSLKLPPPNEVVLLELLMSTKPESRFILVRPTQ